MRVESLAHFQRVTAYQFYVKPADENYFLARWALVHQFHREFFWQALQSIEKYLKAGLLLNDCNAKGGHDIVALYKKHCKVFNGIAIQEFTKPAGLGNEYWDEGKVEKFIERIEQFGSPNSRYGLVPFVRRQSDLFKLDQLVYSLRRLSVPLEWTIGEDWPVDEASKKHAGSKVRDALQADPDFYPREPIDLKPSPINLMGENRLDALHAWNFSFSRHESDINRPLPNSVVPQSGPFENSYLYLFWEELNRTDRAPCGNVVLGMTWVLENVPIGKGAKELLKEKLDELAKN